VTHHRSGRAAEGLVDIERALKMRPQDVDTIEWRALILEKLGRTQDAVAGFRAALALDPSAAQSKEGLKRLGAAR
jgi:Flp pilus assembly protein TadD